MTKLLIRAHDWIQDAPLEPSTLEKYAYSLGQLARSGIEEVETVTRKKVRRFMLEKRQAGASAATVCRDLAALCSFLGWLEQFDEFPLEELAKIRTLFRTAGGGAADRPPPDFLMPHQYYRLLDTANTIAPELSLAISIAVHSGLRFEEVRSLWRTDFVLTVAKPFLRVQKTHDRRIKTKKERTVPIARAFADELLGRGFHQGDGPIFPATRLRRIGDPLLSPYVSRQTLQEWLRNASRASGIKCTWTTFRHTYASWLIQQDVSVAKVAKFLGNGILVCYQHYGALIPGGDSEVERGFKGLRKLESAGRL